MENYFQLIRIRNKEMMITMEERERESEDENVKQFMENEHEITF